MSGNIEHRPGSGPVILSGSWTTAYLAEIESKFIRLADIATGAELLLDASPITAMDTGGAWLLHRLLTHLAEQGVTVHPVGLRREYSELLSLVKARLKEPETKAEVSRQPGLLEWLGRRTWVYLDEGV